MKTEKIQKLYTDYGFGFPVKISNAPLKKVRNEWSLDINFNIYEKAVLTLLAVKRSRLTGNEIKFIRNYYSMNFSSFGKRFGNVAHSAVIKWEKYEDSPTNMNWACEKDIRLFIINDLKPKMLTSVYNDLADVASTKVSPIKIDFEDLVAA